MAVKVESKNYRNVKALPLMIDFRSPEQVTECVDRFIKKIKDRLEAQQANALVGPSFFIGPKFYWPVRALFLVSQS